MNSNHHLDRIHALNLEFAAVEQKLLGEIANLKDQEQAVSAKLCTAQQQAEQDEGEQNRLREETRQVRQELQALFQTLAQREQEVVAQLLAVQQQAAQEKTEQARSHSEQERALHRQHTEREQALSQQLQAGQEELHRLQQDRALRKKEEALQAQSASALQQAQDQAKAHFNMLAERESAFGQQLEALQTQMRQVAEQANQREQDRRAQSAGALHEAQEKAEIHLRTLVAREQAFSGQIHELQAQMRQALEQAAQREQALQAQSASAIQEAQEKAHGHLKTLAEREQVFSQQLQELQAHMREANHGASQREQALRELASQTYRQAQTQAQGHLHSLAQREQAFAQQFQARQAQVDEAQKTAAELTRELHRQSAESLDQANAQIQTHLLALAQREQAFAQQLQARQAQVDEAQKTAAEQTRALHRQSAESVDQANAQIQTHLLALAHKEQAFGRELKELRQEMANDQSEASQREHSLRENATNAQQKANEQLAQRSENWAQLEKELAKKINHLHDEAQALQHAQQLQKQEYEYQLSARHEAQTHLIEKFAAFEAQLQSEMTLERQTSLLIRESLAAVQQNLSSTHASLAWRVTAPLRVLAGLVSPQKALDIAPVAAPQSSSSEPDPSFASSPSKFMAAEPWPLNRIQHLAVNLQVLEAAIAKPEPTIETMTIFSESTAAQAQSLSITQTMLTPPPATYSTAPIRATSLDELLACHDDHFVRSAYKTLLDREPDPEGLGYSLGRLRQGISKIQIVAQLKFSKEGNVFAADLPGLKRATNRYQQEQHPLIGWLFKRLHGAETNRPAERHLRAIENQLYLLNIEGSCRFNQIEAALSGLQHLVAQQTQSGFTLLGNTPPLDTSSTNGTPIKVSGMDGLQHLTSRARDIYFRLENAAATRARRGI